MNSGWSIPLYRFLMQAYPAEFRNQYGDAVDQAFRDLHRDAFQKRGYLGLALLWFHVVPDFLFSTGEVLLAKAGDFLKWRFRLQWVAACTLGFILSRLTGVALGSEFSRALDAIWSPWMYLGTILQVGILLGSVGLLQSRVLAGRCFRKKQWVLYGLGGAVLGTLVFSPPWVAAGLHWLHPVQMVIFGACAGLMQSFAIKNVAIARYRWMTACALGYFLSAVAGDLIREQTSIFAIETVLSALVRGTVLGLVTSGPLERILFSIQADSKEQS